ncbi:outer membrane receptor for ferrienterochelin and colicin [Dyadobacter jejuensis]|uniref:Outer membrane receptor for ferrienterochelin and colicin n=1 Tax=Dyadobacter jejuensis TaxID=1082580 RepID=A0A316B4X3_9BACT|nr:TonB-dependent receptor [Dyadobacter jejuensis]PWJ57677.1 outer membrane receptor for ferrienterochelin and colicin [Dyadobacter jejuensis]
MKYLGLRLWMLGVCLLASVSAWAQQTVIISGYVQEKHSKEAISGVSVTVVGSNTGTVSNTYGFYSLEIPIHKTAILQFSAVGYASVDESILADSDQTIPVFLAEQAYQLAEFTVKTKAVSVASPIEIPVAVIKDIPSLLGERDIIKTLQLLPGVKMGTEGFASYFVRGGGADQNLILLDEAPVYNPNHVFGLFSAFNVDAIKSVTFYKDRFPARYGGRLSSVLDLQMKEGATDKIHVEGGIGLTSSRLSVNGPIVKDKASFMVSGRRSYLDLVTKPFTKGNYKPGYYFQDLNAKLNWKLNDRNKLYASAYFGKDHLSLKETVNRSTSQRKIDQNLGWGNFTTSLRWNHQFSQKLFANTTAYYTQYRFFTKEGNYYLKTDDLTQNLASFSSSLNDYSLKSDFDYYLSNKHQFQAGIQLTRHAFRPRDYSYRDEVNNTGYAAPESYVNHDASIYLEDQIQWSPKLKTNVGVRLSGLATAQKSFLFAEPRLSLQYQGPKRWFATLSYNRNNQFIHLLSNTGLGLSTDLYVPVTDQSPAQQSDQISFGIQKRFEESGLTLNVDTYRKWMRNIVAYKEGTSFISFDDGPQDLPWTDNITVGKGWSYGTEFLLKKEQGKLTGWVGYTLSWTIHQFEEINSGKRFFPTFDRRHDLSVVSSYALSERVKLSANWVFLSGNRLTVPQSYSYGYNGQPDRFHMGNDLQLTEYFGSRNSYQAEAYHRLDLGIQLHKKKKWGEQYWEFGLYNAYFRKNPTYYYLSYSTVRFDGENGELGKVTKKSLFPVVPSVSYNFKF